MFYVVFFAFSLEHMFLLQIHIIQSVNVSVNVVVVCQRYLQLTEDFLKGENPAVVRSRLSPSRAAGDQTDGQTDINGQTHKNTLLIIYLVKNNTNHFIYHFIDQRS